MTLEKYWLTNLVMPPFIFKLKGKDEIYVCDRIEITREGTQFHDDRLGNSFTGQTEVDFIKDIESRRLRHVSK